MPWPVEANERKSFFQKTSKIIQEFDLIRSGVSYAWTLPYQVMENPQLEGKGQNKSRERKQMSNDSALLLFSLAGNVNPSTERCCLAPLDYSSYLFASAISASLPTMGYTSSWNMDLYK